MSLSALDIVALARSGFNAEQISLLNKAVLETPEPVQSTQSTPLSTVSTEPTKSTEPTEVPAPSTQSTPPDMQHIVEAPAPAPESKAAPEPDPAPAAVPAGPTMQDLFAKIAALETRLSANAINNIQQPDQAAGLTGEQVLASILDPRE